MATEYVLVDKDGRSREYFDTRDDAIEHLRCEEQGAPGITAGWMLQAYDDDGKEACDTEHAADLLPGAREIVAAGERCCIFREGVWTGNYSLVVFGSAHDTQHSATSMARRHLMEALFGKRQTTRPELLHLPIAAIGMTNPAQGEMAQPSR